MTCIWAVLDNDLAALHMELKHSALRHIDEVHIIMEHIFIERVQTENSGAGFLKVLVVDAAANGTPAAFFLSRPADPKLHKAPVSSFVVHIALTAMWTFQHP